MEASLVSELTDYEQNDQNTNRSEACASSTCAEIISADDQCTTEMKIAESDEMCVRSEVELKVETAFQIPTIIVTNASDKDEEMAEESTQAVSTSMDEICIEDSSKGSHNEEEEDEKFLEANNGVDTASDDEFEVICRCSSTPLSTSNITRPNITSPKNGMNTSIDETSPIRKESDKQEKGENKGKEGGDGTQSSPSPSRSPSIVYIQPHGEEGASNESGDINDSELLNSSAYDVSTLASFSQQIPVYNVNGTTVTYVSGPQTAVTDGATAGACFSAFQREGGCQVQIPNGLTHGNFQGAAKTDPQRVADPNLEGENLDQLAGESTGTAMVPQPDAFNFVYPSIYVSNAGLISVLLRHDMSVEMTVDRTIRVVSHQHMMAVATDSRGTSACLYHPALKVIQQGTTTDIATDAVRVHMGHDDVAFAVGHSRYRFDAYDIQPATHVKFSDIFKDQSVNLLFSSEGYGESLVPQCLEVAAKAEYANLPKGGVIVRINGVKVTQTGGGDVTVVTGAKFIRLSPSLGMTRLGNRFIDIEIERDWSSRVSRGPHAFFAGERRIIISNGKLEVDVNEQGRFKVAHLQPRRPVTAQQCLRQPESYVRRVNSVTYIASSAARAAAAAASRAPPSRRRSAPVGVSL